jgi:transposase-like protein
MYNQQRSFSMQLEDIVRNRVTLGTLNHLEQGTTLQLLHTTTLLAVIVAQTLMEKEIAEQAGERYGRKDKGGVGYYRHSSNPGSVRINSEKIPIQVPRLRHRESGKVMAPEIYKQMHEAEVNDETARKIIKGISTRNYDEATRTIAESFGLSRGAVSKDMIEASKASLKRFESRDLSAEKYVALFIDGKHFAKEQIIIAMAVTASGHKHIVGMTQAPAESGLVVKQLLKDLVKRGFSYDGGLLCISDGSKGIASAINAVFGEDAAHQRCRVHKIENVVAHLSEDLSKQFKKKLWNAYNTDDYHEAKALLIRCVNDLRKINPTAARSLEEGMEETLTLQKLTINDLFSKGFGTTNCIESVNSQLESCTGKVKNWQKGDMRQRWVAIALEQIEPKLNRVSNFKRLNLIVEALQKRKKKR